MEIDKPRHLPSSLRYKKRYIIFDVISEHQIEFDDLTNSIWTNMIDLFGENESSKFNVWIIQNLYDKKRQRCVLKCSNKSVELIRAALTLIQIVSEHKCIVNVVGVCGTIKSAKFKYNITSE